MTRHVSARAHAHSHGNLGENPLLCSATRLNIRRIVCISMPYGGGCSSVCWAGCFSRVREWIRASAVCPGASARHGRGTWLGDGTRVIHRGDAAAWGRTPEKSRDPQKSASRPGWWPIGTRGVSAGRPPLALSYGRARADRDAAWRGPAKESAYGNAV
jgi:hypothetical protein